MRIKQEDDNKEADINIDQVTPDDTPTKMHVSYPHKSYLKQESALNESGFTYNPKSNKEASMLSLHNESKEKKA